MFYFAYGSNMSREKMNRRLNRNVEGSCELGILPGYELVFDKVMKNQKVAANLSENEGLTTTGILYSDFTEEDFTVIDKLEGVSKGSYHRELVKVWLPREEKFVEAVTYICTNPDKLREGMKPTKEYMSYLLLGRDLLPQLYFQWLLSIETEETSKIEGQISNFSGKER